MPSRLDHPLTRLIPAGALLALAACTALPPAGVPDALQPGAGAELALRVPASGVQIYECRASATPGAAPQWTFVAPDAKLYDASGREMGEHGAGPHWTAHDGSRVFASVRALADAPSGNAIPWLLLAATPENFPGQFGNITHIQRLNTVGGVAPAGGCTDSRIGSVARVPYTADYLLFRSASAQVAAR